MSHVPKRLDLPLAQRPSWETRDPRCDLYYLGWGLRDYGRYPTGGRTQGGWSYTLVLRGSPTLDLEGHCFRLAPRDAVLFPVAFSARPGFRDERGALSEVLVWIWRTPPGIPDLRKPAGEYAHCRMSEESRERFRALHALCRREVERSDEFSTHMLQGYRFQMDAELARHLRLPSQASSRQQLAERAVRWLEQHLHQPKPVFALCDYLQVLWSTLDRLFRDAFGQTPSAYHRALCMQRAQELLNKGELTAKQIAFDLGYKHPNDFSRAFSQFQRRRARRNGRRKR